ncbi:hypothetical protein EVAR_78448_1 [Eumeta japonica]|uniref:Uncharacterized protein n=1 Tax=Eumeta variegata TaxID=151549 RepID=A0A4C1TYA4_EUMVA|nr:hypothetical protein EVAR_78448_1 [Eumeta japonica]
MLFQLHNRQLTDNFRVNVGITATSPYARRAHGGPARARRDARGRTFLSIGAGRCLRMGCQLWAMGKSSLKDNSDTSRPVTPHTRTLSGKQKRPHLKARALKSHYLANESETAQPCVNILCGFYVKQPMRPMAAPPSDVRFEEASADERKPPSRVLIHVFDIILS